MRIRVLLGIAFLAAGLGLTGPARAGGAEWEKNLNAGIAQYQKHDYAQAERYLQAALREAKSFPKGDVRFLSTYLNLGLALAAQGKWDQAEWSFEQALPIARAKGKEHLPRIQSELGRIYLGKGKPAEAAELFESSLESRKAAYGPDHYATALAMNDLASAYSAMERFEDAEPLFQAALPILEKARGPDHPIVLKALKNYKNCLAQQQKPAAAAPVAERILALEKKQSKPGDESLRAAQHDLVAIYMNLERWTDAEPLLGEMIANTEASKGKKDPELIAPLNELGIVLLAQEKRKEAVDVLERARGIAKKADDPVAEVRTEMNLGAAYRDMDEDEKAEKLLTGARTRLDGLDEPHPGLMADLLDHLGKLRGKQGNVEEAKALFDEAQDLRMRQAFPGGNAPEGSAPAE